MDSKLKSLKVVDLRAILSKANVSCPAKSNKQDLIARIIASQPATQIYYQLYPDKSVYLLNTSPFSFTSHSQKCRQSPRSCTIGSTSYSLFNSFLTVSFRLSK
jgi:hypothetical protein